ncbi:hypothetical protein BVC80_8021g1 [Macleaya cordata]|uniref:Uncharacterized protein n=1 Tax=Macleaya cordata TaxID=56857 RepID=A0A200QMY2_MACCD|nr:hypothetical protein BVC80_8021g1 [Macleaya cordata]
MKVTLDDSDSSSNTSDSSNEKMEEMKAMTATLSLKYSKMLTLLVNMRKSKELSKENKVLDGKLTFMQTERDEAIIKLQESSNKIMQLEEEISRLLIKINSLELDHEKALDEIKSLNSTLDVTKRDLPKLLMIRKDWVMMLQPVPTHHKEQSS